MNNKRLAAMVAALSLFVSAVSPATVRAADEASYDAPTGEESFSMPVEAARAIFGRVFGIMGDAGDIRYHEFDLSGRSPAHAAVRSALVPGWGQMFNDQRVKGTVFFLTAVGATVGSVALLQKSNNSYDDYRNLGVKNDGRYDDYRSEQAAAGILAGVAAVLWVSGIVDAYRNAYAPLYGRNDGIDLVYADGETGLRWKRHFQ